MSIFKKVPHRKDFFNGKGGSGAGFQGNRTPAQRRVAQTRAEQAAYNQAIRQYSNAKHPYPTV